MPAAPDFRLLCPQCGAALDNPQGNTRRCAGEGHEWRSEAGIWRLLGASERDRYRPFLQQYGRVRNAEGWGTGDAEFYRALPFEDPSQRHPEVWRIRAQSYRCLERRVIRRLASQLGRPLQIVDVGAGNGWLSHRLTRGGHTLAAVDVNLDDHDGLGALACYADPSSILAVEAGFDRLPFDADQADLLIFNGSIHYATSYRDTLTEALRVARPDGSIVIMDTPYYPREADGEQMLQEQRRSPGKSAESNGSSEWFTGRGFLTAARLARVCAALSLQCRLVRTPAAWRATAATVKARLVGRRARAAFPLIVLTRERA